MDKYDYILRIPLGTISPITRHVRYQAGSHEIQWGSVQGMGSLFRGASSFNQDISGWDTSSSQNMGGMFDGATIFNQDISGWTVDQASTMSIMFRNAEAFHQDLSGWDPALTAMNACANFAPGATAWLAAYGGSIQSIDSPDSSDQTNCVSRINESRPPLSASMLAKNCSV